MRISDWSSDVCSSDLEASRHNVSYDPAFFENISIGSRVKSRHLRPIFDHHLPSAQIMALILKNVIPCPLGSGELCSEFRLLFRSEEHTSELQSLMRISYAVFCLKKNKKTNYTTNNNHYVLSNKYII